MLKTRSIGVTNVATVVASATVAPGDTAALSLAGASLYDSIPVVICSTSSTPIWLGGSSMTTNSSNLGLPLVGTPTGTYITYTLLASDPLFAITTGAGPITITVQAARQS